MTTLDDVAQVAGKDRGLAVVSTLRADGTIQASLVNAGVMTDPFTGVPAVAFVSYGRVKLANLRGRPQIAVTFRAGWQWATVEGRGGWSAPTTRTPASTPSGSDYCCAKSSPPRAAPMTTGRNTTG